jgi:hypothetical protein
MRREIKIAVLIIYSLFAQNTINGQVNADSSLQQLSTIQSRFFTTIDKKVDRYVNRVDKKTGRTLERLARWEAKLKRLLEKASPETAARLFAPGQMSFARLYEQYQNGQRIVQRHQQQYDQYRDDLKNSIAYIDSQKTKLNASLLEPIRTTRQKVDAADSILQQQTSIATFIRQRKSQLLEQALRYAGNSRWLRKINSEAWYYAETIRNYKTLFEDESKIEETVMRVLQQVPGFAAFLQQNSQLAALFRLPANYGSPQSLAGLQTRQSIENLITQRLSGAGPNGMQQIRDNMQAAQAELSQLKDKAAQYGGGGSDIDLPNFKPNMTKTKTFVQRIVYDANLQVARANTLVPTATDIALGVGYQLNDKSLVGIGASYRMGLGSIQRIRISHQGIGLRSYIDWKLKKQFFVSGGYELNHQAAFSSIRQLRDYNSWQQAALIGLAKKINMKSRWVKASKIQVLFDALYQQHVPQSQPIIVRTGFSF